MKPNVATVQVENGFFLACAIGWLIGTLLVVGLPVAFFAWLFDAYLVMGLSIGIPFFLIVLCAIGIVREK